MNDGRRAMRKPAPIPFALAALLIFCSTLCLALETGWTDQATLPAEFDAAPDGKPNVKPDVKPEKSKSSSTKSTRKKPQKVEAQASPPSNIVARSASGRFSKDAQGVITDTQTGLSWLVGPDKPTSWQDAQAWVKGLSAKSPGWRLPLRSELYALVGSGETAGRRGGSRIDPIFQLTACCVWSSESGEASEPPFHVCYCRENWFRRVFNPHFRAFAVRSRP
jgi:hypothetical protein